MNILIIRAFVKLREIPASSKELAHRLEAVERTLKRQGHAIALVYDEVKKLQAPPATPKRRIVPLPRRKAVVEPHASRLRPRP